jgi:hypothetical protein
MITLFIAIFDAIRKYGLASLFQIKIILVADSKCFLYASLLLNICSLMIKIFLFETKLFNHTFLSHRKWQQINKN